MIILEGRLLIDRGSVKFFEGDRIVLKINNLDPKKLEDVEKIEIVIGQGATIYTKEQTI